MKKKNKKRVFDCDLSEVNDDDLRDKLGEILDLDIEISDFDSNFISRMCFRGPFKISFPQRRLALKIINRYLGGDTDDVACESNS